MPNALTYWAIRARHLLSHVFEHWLWRYRYFLSKVNIYWNVNCARATAFIFDTQTGVLVKVPKFLRQKMSNMKVLTAAPKFECPYSTEGDKCAYTNPTLKTKDRQFDIFFRHWWHRKLLLQLTVPPVMTKLSNWPHFFFIDWKVYPEYIKPYFFLNYHSWLVRLRSGPPRKVSPAR